MRARAPRWALYVGGIGVALVALWILVPSMKQRTQEASGPGSIKSLAVLPLVNLSGDPSQEYFADGVTEELIAELGKISALRVISRTSVMQYKNSRKPIPEVARELNVGAVVEGSVQRADGRVRIRARLVDAANDRQLWSESYERDAQDVLRLQDQVAEAIAAAITVELTPEERNRLASARRVDPRAHEAYLQGRYYVDRETLADLQQAIAHFEAAIAVDPTYAPAHAGLAESYYNASTMFLPPSEAMPRARAAALRALEIDPTLPQALVALGTVRTFYDWDWRRGPADLERAVALNPGDALAHKIYGYYLAIVRRFDEAIQQLQLARELDPLSLHTRVFALFPLYEGRRYDEAIEGALKVLATHPSAWNARWILGQAYLQKKEYSKAIEAFRRASEDKGAEESAVLALLGSAYAAAGERDEALKILKQLLERPRDIQLHAYQVAVLYVALDDRNRAFEWLEKSLEQRSEDVLFLQNDPLLDALRPDPRFARLLQRIGFPK
jgi:TolB-like protein/Flp pilus assembly protein TadD